MAGAQNEIENPSLVTIIVHRLPVWLVQGHRRALRESQYHLSDEDNINIYKFLKKGNQEQNFQICLCSKRCLLLYIAKILHERCTPCPWLLSQFQKLRKCLRKLTFMFKTRAGLNVIVGYSPFL